MSTQHPTQPQYYSPPNQPAGIATASVVLGAVGFVVGICSVIGLVLGLIARGKAKRGEISSARVTAGIVTSAISLALGVVGWIALLALMGAAGSSMEEASTSISAPSVVEEAQVDVGAPTLDPGTDEVAPAEAAAPAPAPSATSAVAAPAQAAPEEAAPARPAPQDAAPAAAASVAQENAVRAAENYLDFSAFSRTGLIDQLEFEGYSAEDATYGVDHITVDWNEQAAKSAKNYLDFSSFSRQGLIDQLEFEGYTSSEAEYGVSQTGL
ncbi:Ltp family lipoprotein [Kineococcus terrestris]|uniref:Ltp family lipoprotein n=1 Tax=Kineococcus terrestris TaxID=2044856 RepID=UPI0034DB56D1